MPLLGRILRHASQLFLAADKNWSIRKHNLKPPDHYATLTRKLPTSTATAAFCLPACLSTLIMPNHPEQRYIGCIMLLILSVVHICSNMSFYLAPIQRCALSPNKLEGSWYLATWLEPCVVNFGSQGLSRAGGFDMPLEMDMWLYTWESNIMVSLCKSV